MDNLQILLLILGGLAILAILLHEFLWNKKERKSPFKNDVKEKKQQQTPPVEPFADWNNVDFNENNDPLFNHIKTDEKPFHERSALSESAASENAAFSTKSHSTQKPDSMKHREPAAPIKEEEKKEEIFVLHVTGMGDKLLQGNALLTSMLQTGLRFGEMNIFHRHVDMSGEGPVLFSVANMIKPGTFYLREIPEMMTPGISLFMLVPSFGDAKQNFKLMLQTAQRIADDVGGVVLDSERKLLTPQKIAFCIEKIKLLTAK